MQLVQRIVGAVWHVAVACLGFPAYSYVASHTFRNHAASVFREREEPESVHGQMFTDSWCLDLCMVARLASCVWGWPQAVPLDASSHQKVEVLHRSNLSQRDTTACLCNNRAITRRCSAWGGCSRVPQTTAGNSKIKTPTMHSLLSSVGCVNEILVLQVSASQQKLLTATRA